MYSTFDIVHFAKAFALVALSFRSWFSPIRCPWLELFPCRIPKVKTICPSCLKTAFWCMPLGFISAPSFFAMATASRFFKLSTNELFQNS